MKLLGIRKLSVDAPSPPERVPSSPSILKEAKKGASSFRRLSAGSLSTVASWSSFSSNQCEADDFASAFLCLVANEKWASVRRVLSEEMEQRKGSDQPKSPRLNRDDLCRALRSACRCRPPPDVVRSIVELCPDAASESDYLMGRFPLHVAVEHAASVEVIEILADRHPSAAGAQDASGKTPLHVLCESYVKRCREPGHGPKSKKEKGAKAESPPLDECMPAIIRCLRSAAPYCVNLEDKEDMSALEYAVDNLMNKKMVNTIHIWSQRDWKNQKKPGYGQPGAQEGLWVFKNDAEEDALWTTSAQEKKESDEKAGTKKWQRLPHLRRSPKA